MQKTKQSPHIEQLGPASAGQKVPNKEKEGLVDGEFVARQSVYGQEH